ncbi:AraC family transcriptional regulator [Streptomyces sp. NBC_00038]|uniref:helix-turn-helix domain-containing protein n=1 Tax=Streptomyces sp. NBC_00038 TaxID=2903615 RepID=UPI002259CC34|nr:AraC family transcriptional regulator [Streptomyces sp. NBC_00038]MCX5562689.1 AraC family transcriptional regulator [Streptomyces sp. NBC_00038]
MVKNGQTSITDVAYRPELGAPIGMDVLDFTELRARGRRRGIDLGAPMRPAFHHLIHVRAGTLHHSVDFTDHELPAGSWIWIRPGQVHRYTPADLATARGTFVIWQPGFVAAEPPYDQSPLLPTGPHARAVQLALRHLTQEYADLASIPLDAHIEAVRHLLAVLLLRLAHAGPAPASPVLADDTFRRYHAAVERDFARTHRVADHAASLGYSVRTLTRATLAATGHTAKQHLDARILLEAKRLLVHTDASAAAVGTRLGFTDPGDFSKFFRKRDGRTPLEFRAMARGRGG